MKSPLTPNDIEVLFWCYSRPEPHERIGAPAVEVSLRMWLDAGMIKPADARLAIGTFTTTDKGDAMVASLCNTPEPRCVWVTGECRTSADLK